MAYLRSSILALLAVVAIVGPTQLPAEVLLDGIGVSGRYSSVPFYPPYYGFDSYLYSPFWPMFPISPEASTGKVLLQHAASDAQIFINGGYAGEASKLKSLRLESGVYDLESRSSKGKFEQRIYVLSGKTLKIDLQGQAQP